MALAMRGSNYFKRKGLATISIFKTSNHSPNLTEIDLNENNEFSCQVNTSGESVLAYKLKILSKSGDEIIYDPDEPTSLSKPVKNNIEPYILRRLY